LCVPGPGNRQSFGTLVTALIPQLDLAFEKTQCFPFYAYNEDGSNRRENITDWALNEFRTHYGDPNITRWDIFHYVYAVLHHPEYRERYAANLKRELPRIPFVKATADPSTRAEALGRDDSAREGGDARTATAPVPPGGTEDDSPALQRWVGNDKDPESLQGRHKTADPSARAEALGRDDNYVKGAERWPKGQLYPDVAPYHDDKDVFWAFAKAGLRLADLHIRYEQQPQHPLERVEKGQLNWRVKKMRLSKDKTTLVYNDFLTLRDIPPETYEYRLGNRSALDWVVDQYQVSTDKRSGITNDPNRADDPEYIVRLIGQVVTVSLETMKIIKALPALAIPSA
jgi:predicted helicase